VQRDSEIQNSKLLKHVASAAAVALVATTISITVAEARGHFGGGGGGGGGSFRGYSGGGVRAFSGGGARFGGLSNGARFSGLSMRSSRFSGARTLSGMNFSKAASRFRSGSSMRSF
jgi:uncharacterized membrane protein